MVIWSVLADPVASAFLLCGFVLALLPAGVGLLKCSLLFVFAVLQACVSFLLVLVRFAVCHGCCASITLGTVFVSFCCVVLRSIVMLSS